MTEKKQLKILHLHTRAIVGGSGTNTLLTLIGLPQEKYCGHLAVGYPEAQADFLEELQSRSITVHLIKHLINTISPARDLLAFFEIVHAQSVFSHEIVEIGAVLAGQPCRLTDISPAELAQANQIIFFKSALRLL